MSVLLLTCQSVAWAFVADVTNFGAKGDGVTDDTAAVQRAIDAVAAADGKTVILFVSYADHPLKCSFEVSDSLGLKGKKITDLDTKQPGSFALDFKRDYEAVCLEFK